MQPLKGKTPMQDFFDRNGGGEGVQHTAFDMKDLSMTERKKKMAEGGIDVARDNLCKGSRASVSSCSLIPQIKASALV